MFLAVLRQQWNTTKVAALCLVALSFALPITAMRGAAELSGPWTAWSLLGLASRWSQAYPLLALAGALAVAVAAWRPDHRARHTYALTLPLPRSRYLLLRYGAGLVLLLAIGIALALGAIVALLPVVLPQGLTAYPVTLALRFLVAAITAYTLMFALSGLTARAARLLVAALLLLVIVSVACDLLGFAWNPLEVVVDALFSPYSPLAVFRARWMLIDA